ncbi:DeoR/GlpR family DNA-binding transcription regulator [Clostridium sp. YIM B02551]|uniref:DeoR/GlpR family DNA-binding transcription regulator n=1 Tax=Clostridium sp. YIM B02551 TaxID=2910679 RepID=UPI001EEA6E0E|nr:DeoR/GlpR family DNA-binding transcription regulator [Clostridium sp. YIM B02551]
MFAEERLQEILDELNINGKVTVKDLSCKFNVTEDCIRKDLRNLESKGFLKKTYGGAIQKRKTADMDRVPDRMQINTFAKEKIAEKAFNLIKERETIFLDISTTNILLAKLLANSNKPVTIVTNMTDIVDALSKENNINVVCTGGVLNKFLDGFTGSSTIEFINKYKFDKAFVGSSGVDILDNNITTFDIEDGNTKKAVINSSRETYLVMESNKFYYDGPYKFATFKDIKGILTDSAPETDILDVLDEFNINII